MKPDRLTNSYPDLCRKRIHGSNALKYLVAVVDGKQDPDLGRIQACRILLGKVLPDLKAIDHTGDVVTRVVVKFNP